MLRVTTSLFVGGLLILGFALGATFGFRPPQKGAVLGAALVPTAAGSSINVPASPELQRGEPASTAARVLKAGPITLTIPADSVTNSDALAMEQRLIAPNVPFGLQALPTTGAVVSANPSVAFYAPATITFLYDQTTLLNLNLALSQLALYVCSAAGCAVVPSVLDETAHTISANVNALGSVWIVSKSKN